MIQFNQSDPSFKTVATLMTNAICLGCGLEVTKYGSMTELKPNYVMGFEGNPKGTNEILIFEPYDLINSVLVDAWPSLLEFEEIPYVQGKILRKKSRNELCFHGEQLSLIQKLIVMSNFVYYYESVKDLIENKYGTEPIRWPDTLKFARVIRNAFAHGGRIEIRNNALPPVRWKNYSYSYQDNGKQILPNDLNIPEIIVLLKEMDSYI